MLLQAKQASQWKFNFRRGCWCTAPTNSSSVLLAAAVVIPVSPLVHDLSKSLHLLSDRSWQHLCVDRSLQSFVCCWVPVMDQKALLAKQLEIQPEN